MIEHLRALRDALTQTYDYLNCEIAALKHLLKERQEQNDE